MSTPFASMSNHKKAEPKVSRRRALHVLGAGCVTAAVFSACSKQTEPEACSDLSALSEAEKGIRTSLQYVDHSPQAEKHCQGCSLFQAPAEPTQCGGCQVVKGPIHPDGYCINWVAKA